MLGFFGRGAKLLVLISTLCLLTDPCPGFSEIFCRICPSYVSFRAKRGQEDYTNIAWKDIQTYITYDVFGNDFFVVGNRLLRQKKGNTIRRIMSTQLHGQTCL